MEPEPDLLPFVGSFSGFGIPYSVPIWSSSAKRRSRLNWLSRTAMRWQRGIHIQRLGLSNLAMGLAILHTVDALVIYGRSKRARRAGCCSFYWSS